ncbi:MAG TPA: peptide ABC transporter substrate-binding protein [Tepidisphaeraceae bacterium]|jgi:oligopeptide transport system substrate-binding protein|nr:peptide ABC transporter substrate-binding protein [Tepidisphaeraceae bacterium]
MRSLLLAPLVLLVPLIVAMTWSGSATERPADFTFVNRDDINTLDPKGMSWMQDIRVGYALWEGLYQLDPVTLKAVPGVAETIDVSPDKKQWTFHFRPDAKWNNGDPVTPRDFVFAWKRMLDDPGDYSYLLRVIKNAGPYSDAIVGGQTADFDDVGIKVIDDRTLRVTLERPVVYFADLCAFPPMFPLHEASMKRHVRRDTGSGGVTRYDPKFTRDLPLVTNGPFMLTKWEFKKRLRMEKSVHYWDHANVKSDVIEQVSASMHPAFLMYETGGVDWVAEVTGDIASELREKVLKGERNDLRVFPSFGTYFYSFNCNAKFADGKPNPLADPRVRRALSMAVDKRIIVDNVTRMGEQPADTYIPRGAFADYNSPDGPPFDVAGARKLLAEAGYPDGRGFPALSILFNSGMQHGDIAQSVVNQWKANLGISISLEGVEIKVFRQRLHNKDYSIARASWFGDYNDPSTFTDKYRSVAENNDAAWINPAYDALCDAAANETDPAIRMRHFEKAERLLLDEAPILPMYYYVNSYLHRDNVKGIPQNVRNMVSFKSFYVER